MQRFDPPGHLEDFDENQRNLWSDAVGEWLRVAKDGDPAENDGPRTQFFNALETPPGPDAKAAVISWNAFPRQVRTKALSDRQRWRIADGDRNVQDEYCEWSVARETASGKIVRIAFTCEGPEYWERLAEWNPDKVLELYHRHVSADVRREDLFPGGVYDPRNRFNRSTTDGAMHLIQRANTLRAEIELGAAATIRRAASGREITEAQELIGCSLYGAAGRNSDPFIGEQVNALARQGADITLNNPVGLYFEGFNPVGWKTPDGTDPREFWKFVRGRDGYFVRAVFEVSAARGYAVGDITIADRPIEFGAQIADYVTIKLEGLATRFGSHTSPPVEGCRGRGPVVAALAVEAPGEPLVSRAEGSAPVSDDAGGGQPVSVPEGLRELLSVDESGEVSAAALQPYPSLPESAFKPRSVSGRVVAYASPDSTFAVTRKLLEEAKRSIVVGIYDFGAGYLKEELKRALKRNVSVVLMLDTNSQQEHDLLDELERLGADTAEAPSRSSGNPNACFGNAHEKIIVVDGEVVMIQSGNWSENSIPQNEGDGVVVGHFQPGNRDMGLAVYSRELASFFADLVARDMRLSRGEPVAGTSTIHALDAGGTGEVFIEAAPGHVPETLFPSLWKPPGAPVRITPAVTPENFHGVALELLRTARRRIWIEQQYIRGGQAPVEQLLDEIAARRTLNPDLDLRIIVSPKYLYGKYKDAFLKTMSDHGFGFDDHFRYLSPAHFVHCHNKLILVDDDRTLLGSQNWSSTGLLSNREASLLVEDPAIASYFAGIFEADWHMSEPTVSIAEIDPTTTPSAGRPFVISSGKDYADV